MQAPPTDPLYDASHPDESIKKGYTITPKSILACTPFVFAAPYQTPTTKRKLKLTAQNAQAYRNEDNIEKVVSRHLTKTPLTNHCKPPYSARSHTVPCSFKGTFNLSKN